MSSITFRRSVIALAVGATMLTSGCASIFNGGPRKIPVASSPPGATVSIYNRDNQLVTKQTTPFTAELPPKYRYFQAQRYRAVFEMPGYQSAEVQLNPTISGWYFGNIAFGGLIGMVFIDPNTGAMYNFAPNKINQALEPQTTQATQ